MSEKKEPKTVADVLATFTEEQRSVVYFMIGTAIEEYKKNQNGTKE